MTTISTFAYLDPGTGSMLLQAIVGGGAGIVVLVRHLWQAMRVAKKPLEPNPSGADA